MAWIKCVARCAGTRMNAAWQWARRSAGVFPRSFPRMSSAACPSKRVIWSAFARNAQSSKLPRGRIRRLSEQRVFAVCGHQGFAGQTDAVEGADIEQHLHRQHRVDLTGNLLESLCIGEGFGGLTDALIAGA